jgi:hypothetical protein
MSNLATSRDGSDVKLNTVLVLPELPSWLDGDKLRCRLASGVRLSRVSDDELVAASIVLARSLGRSICSLVRLGNASFGILEELCLAAAPCRYDLMLCNDAVVRDTNGSSGEWVWDAVAGGPRTLSQAVCKGGEKGLFRQFPWPCENRCM